MIANTMIIFKYDQFYHYVDYIHWSCWYDWTPNFSSWLPSQDHILLELIPEWKVSGDFKSSSFHCTINSHQFQLGKVKVLFYMYQWEQILMTSTFVGIIDLDIIFPAWLNQDGSSMFIDLWLCVLYLESSAIYGINVLIWRLGLSDTYM